MLDVRYATVPQDDRPTIPAAPAAKRFHSGVQRRTERPEIDALLVEFLDESKAPDTVPRPALISAIAERMNEQNE